MKISRIVGREIFDSRGLPTVSCEVVLDDGTLVEASVPSGASKGFCEAFELRDGGKRLHGLGVSKAIQNIDSLLAPQLVGKEPDLIEMDALMCSLDGTPEKTNLGANAILAVSMALARAQAVVEEMELFELLASLHGADSVSLPFPMLNVINGGAHANNGFPLQELLLVPVGAQNFRTSLECALTVFQELKHELLRQKKLVGIGDEGGYVSDFSSVEEAFDIVVTVLQKTGLEDLFVLAMDVAADQLYNQNTQDYRWVGTQKKSTQELVAWYQKMVKTYPIFSIEDGFAQRDKEGWEALSSSLSSTVQIVGDDIFCTRIENIYEAVQNETANAAIIKLNQIGTVSETLQTIAYCQKNGINPIISHRSGETNDSFIADLAVATSSGQIKAGGGCRGERMAKYNRLLFIEDMLTLGILNQVIG